MSIQSRRSFSRKRNLADLKRICCITFFCTGYDRILRHLVAITRALKLTHGAREKLSLHYKQNEWIDITENPIEDELVTLALMRIKQDPNQYDQFVSMLRDIEGMDLIVNTITGGESLSSVVYTLVYFMSGNKK